MLIDLKDTQTFNEAIDLTLPSGVVAGSARAVVSAIGKYGKKSISSKMINGLRKMR